MLKSLRLTVSLLFLVLIAGAQEVTPEAADSLHRVLGTALSKQERLNALLQLASYQVHQRRPSDTLLRETEDHIQEAEQLNSQLHLPYFDEQDLLLRSGLDKARGNIQGGKALLSQAIGQLQHKNNKALLGKAYYEMSDFYSGNFLQNTMLERVRYLNLAIEAYQQTDQWVQLARCYRFLADLHQLLNDDAKAFAEVKTALKYYDQAGYKEKQGATSLLGRLYYEQGDYKQALRYEIEALKIAMNSKADNVRLICQINNNIGFTYSSLREYPKALQFFTKALEIGEQEKDNATIYLLAANIVETYLNQHTPKEAVAFFQHINQRYPLPAELQYEGGDFGYSQTWLKIYMALHQYDKAGQYCERVIRQSVNPNINFFTLNGYYQIVTQYYLETANYDKAQFYLNKDKSLADSLKNLSGLAQYYRLSFSLDTARGQYKEAISQLIQANAMKDSIFDETKSREIAQLEIEFESEKKENQIVLLNQKAILENTKLRQADFVKNVTIGGIVLLLIIAVLLYRQSSFRKKNHIVATNKNQLLQNLLTEKEWLLKEVHHRVKNNLHTVICLLESQARYLEEDALRAIENSQHRIYAMSLIHQKLYQSDNIGDIDMSVYLRELTNYLSQSFGNPSYIQLQLTVDNIKLNLSQAIPLGLIINEAMTNAFKYAFPDKRQGKIQLELQRVQNNIAVTIADNGVGMGDIDPEAASKSLGLELMRGLIADLEGDIHFENSGGTRITLLFPVEGPLPTKNSTLLSFQSPN